MCAFMCDSHGWNPIDDLNGCIKLWLNVCDLW